MHAIKYKLRMLGISISWALNVYGDNMSLMYNTSKPESTLKKNCNAISYHAVFKSVAIEEYLTGYIRSEDNSAKISTRQRGKTSCVISII